jgi:hypothetical protein
VERVALLRLLPTFSLPRISGAVVDREGNGPPTAPSLCLFSGRPLLKPLAGTKAANPTQRARVDPDFLATLCRWYMPSSFHDIDFSGHDLDVT